MCGKETASEHGNTANRQKTQVANAFKELMRLQELASEDFVIAQGEKFQFATTLTTTIDPKGVLDLYEEGEITRGNFLELISINKIKCKNILGEDEAIRLTTESRGPKADLRIAKATSDEAKTYPEPQIVYAKAKDVIKVKKKSKLKTTRAKRILTKPK